MLLFGLNWVRKTSQINAFNCARLLSSYKQKKEWCTCSDNPPSKKMKDIPLTQVCLFISKGAFLRCSLAQEGTESSKYWDGQPSGAAWVSVESRRVFTFTAVTEGRVWTRAHLCSKWKQTMSSLMNNTKLAWNYPSVWHYVYFLTCVVTRHQ